MKRRRSLLLFLALLCASGALPNGCTPAPETPASNSIESTAPSAGNGPATAEQPTVGSTETEETKYVPTYSALGRRLRNAILLESLENLWKRHTPQTGGYVEVRAGTGGNVYAYTELPIDYLLLAQEDVRDAVSLLVDGKLPGEINRRPVNVDEVEALLGEADAAFTLFIMQAAGYEERFIDWIWEQGNSEFSNEDTVEQVVDQFDFICGCAADASDAILNVLADLPTAVDG